MIVVFNLQSRYTKVYPAIRLIQNNDKELFIQKAVFQKTVYQSVHSKEINANKLCTFSVDLLGANFYFFNKRVYFTNKHRST